MAQAQPHMGGQKPMGRPSREAPGPEGTDPRGGVAAPREAASRKGDQPKGSGQRTHLAPKTHRDGAGAQNTPGKGGRNGTTPEGVNGQTGPGGPPDSLGKGTAEAAASPSFQWMAHIPDRLVRRLQWRATEDAPPQKEIIVLLYAGKDDPGSLDNTLHLMRPSLSPRVMAFDKVREEETRTRTSSGTSRTTPSAPWRQQGTSGPSLGARTAELGAFSDGSPNRAGHHRYEEGRSQKHGAWRATRRRSRQIRTTTVSYSSGRCTSPRSPRRQPRRDRRGRRRPRSPTRCSTSWSIHKIRQLGVPRQWPTGAPRSGRRGPCKDG